MNRLNFPNGLTVLYRQTQSDPICAAHLLLPFGAAHEPAHQAGITTLSWALLNKGTRTRPARKLAEEIESMGAFIAAGASHDYSEMSCHSISDVFEKTLEIMADMLFEPSFLASEVEKERNALLASIRARKESIFTVTQENLHLHLYRSHPYARPASGHEETVKNLKADDLINWHKKISCPKGAILSLASSIPFESMATTLEGLFGPSRWEQPANDSLGEVTHPVSLKNAVQQTHRSKFEQAYLMYGFSAPELTSPDYIPLKVLGGILGGGMSARLFQNLREKNGLAYDVGAYYPTRKWGSGFLIYMGLQHSRIKEAKQRILQELARLQNESVPIDEFRQAVNYLKGTFILDHQTNSQRAHYMGWWEILGRGSDFDRVYLEKLDAVTPKDVHAISQRYLSQPYVLIETHPKSA